MHRLSFIVVLYNLVFAYNAIDPISEMLELYDKNIRPNEKNPVDISVSVYILDNHIVEETENYIMFETMMYFRRYWNDSRLAEKDRPILMGSKDLKNKLWTPDLFFVNCMNVKFFDVPEPNVFVKITPQGTITISEKLLVKWKCPQNLTNFPCDAVDCELYIESYGFGTKDIHFHEPSPDSLSSANGSIPNFVLKKAELIRDVTTFASDTYDRYTVKLALKRHLKDAKFIIANDDRFPKFYSSIPLKPYFSRCDDR